MAARDGELHALVLADRPAEHDTLVGILHSPPQHVAAIAQRLGRHQDALGVQSVEQIAEAHPLLPDQVGVGDDEVVDEDLGRIVVDHRLEGSDLQPTAQALAQVDQEHRQPVRLALDLVERGGARQQQHQVGMQRAGGPDLLPVHDEVVALADGARLEAGRVRPGRRLGHAERLHPDLAGGDAGKVAPLLLLATVPQQRSHDVHLRVALARDASAGIDLLEDHRGGAQRQPGAAILFGNKSGQEPGFRQLGYERRGVGGCALQLRPIGIPIFGTEPSDGPAQLGEVFTDAELHAGPVGRRRRVVSHGCVHVPIPLETPTQAVPPWTALYPWPGSCQKPGSGLREWRRPARQDGVSLLRCRHAGGRIRSSRRHHQAARPSRRFRRTPQWRPFSGCHSSPALRPRQSKACSPRCDGS